MNKKHLFDPVDFAKAGLLQSIKSGASLIKNLMLLPMFTGQGFPKNSNLQQQYEQMLGGKILNSAQFFDSQDRIKYFMDSIRCLKDDSDLFIDPDNGISAAPKCASKKHISIDEIEQLWCKKDRILIIYQDKFNHGGGKQDQQMHALIDQIKSKGMGCFAYFKAWLKPSLVFIGKPRENSTKTRLDLIEDYLKTTVGVPVDKLLN